MVSAEPIALTLEDRARMWIDSASGPWQYLLIFLLAATPLLEILVVIPLGVGLGFEPALVAFFAFAGNVVPIYAIVVGYERLTVWLESRETTSDSGRRVRAQRVWNRYGLPGLSLAAPILTGVHLAALIALGLGARKRATMAWMTLSIAFWTVAITVVSVIGFETIARLWS